MTPPPICSLCGATMISRHVAANIFSCRNCDLYPYIEQPLTKAQAMHQLGIASEAVDEHRKGRDR